MRKERPRGDPDFEGNPRTPAFELSVPSSSSLSLMELGVTGAWALVYQGLAVPVERCSDTPQPCSLGSGEWMQETWGKGVAGGGVSD